MKNAISKIFTGLCAAETRLYMANVFKRLQNFNIQQPEILTISWYQARKYLQFHCLPKWALCSLTVRMFDVYDAYAF